MEENNVCEFCKKIFKNVYLLSRHKLTAKYCLNIQQKNKEHIEIKNTEFICDHCDKIFKNKQNLDTHKITSCKKKFQKNTSFWSKS